MRDKFNKFMQGRYGVDDFSRFIMGVALTLIILTMVVTMFNRNVGSILDFLGIAAIVYAYFRIFSRNIQQRYAENQKYLQMTSKFRLRFNKEKNLMKQRKTHHIYSCPGCGQLTNRKLNSKILTCTVLFTVGFAENSVRDMEYRGRFR